MGCQKDTTQCAACPCCWWETPVFTRSFFRLPVCSTGESFRISCPKLSLCHRRTHELTHSLHTDLILQSVPAQPPSLLLLCFPPTFLSISFYFCTQREGGAPPASVHNRERHQGLYLSVVCHDDEFNVFGRLLSVPFMLKEKQETNKPPKKAKCKFEPCEGFFLGISLSRTSQNPSSNVC